MMMSRWLAEKKDAIEWCLAGVTLLALHVSGHSIYAALLVGTGADPHRQSAQHISSLVWSASISLASLCVLLLVRRWAVTALLVRPQAFFLAFLVWCIAMAAYGSGASLPGLLNGTASSEAPWILGLGYLAVFFGLLYWLYLVRGSDPLTPRTRYLRSERAASRKHLILLLSNLNPGTYDRDTGFPLRRDPSGQVTGPYTPLAEAEATLRGEFEELARQKCDRWNWEMPLRSIHHQLHESEGRLRTVDLVCSHESLQQVHLFLMIISRYRELDKTLLYVWVYEKVSEPDIKSRPQLRIPCSGKKLPDLSRIDGHDFESFDAFSRSFLRLFECIRKEEKAREEDIILDFTGGTKPATACAMAVTIGRAIQVQYVYTNDKTRIESFDFVPEPEQSPA